jgi:hypothetical protein
LARCGQILSILLRMAGSELGKVGAT